jgi:hypothetical protein
MFQLTNDELENLKSHIVISRWGGVRKIPLAFTEQSVAMLSGIFNSVRAIEINIPDHAGVREALRHIFF